MVDASQESLLTMDQVAKRLGIGKSKAYDLITQEGLPVVRMGRTIRVDPESLREWIKQHETKQQ